MGKPYRCRSVPQVQRRPRGIHWAACRKGLPKGSAACYVPPVTCSESRPPSALHRHLRGFGIAIFLLTAAARLAVVFSGVAPYASDAGTYLMPARNLVAGRGYVDDEGKPYAFRPPTYPLFLAAVFRIAGESPRAAMVTQALLAAAGAAGLAAWVARRHGLGAGAAAGALVALDPILIPVPAFILTEALGTLLVAGTVMCLDHGLAARHPGWLLAGGILGGAAALNTPITLLLVPWLLCAAWAVRSPRRPDWRAMALALAAVVLLVGAWTTRNALVRGDVVVIRDNGFASLVWATTEFDFDYLPNPYEPGWADLKRKFDTLSVRPDAHAAFLREAWRNVGADPLLVLKRVVKANFWFWVEAPGHHLSGAHRWIRWPTLLFHWLQLLGLVAALALLRRAGRLREWTLWLAAIAYFALFLSPLMPIPRYYVPLLPVMDTVIAVCLVGLAARRAPRRAPVTA